MTQIHSKADFTSGWRLFGASLQGIDHIKRSMPCQDAFEFGTLGDLLWIAVADGLSGELNSDFGARVAVRYVGSTVRNASTELVRWTSSDVRRIFEHCCGELNRQSALVGCQPRELSTTLQVALADMKFGLLHYGVLGDGGCIASLSNGAWLVLGDKRHRPPIGTSHLLHSDRAKYIHVETLPLDFVQSLFVFTDGLDRLLLERRSKENIGIRVNTADAIALKDAMYEVENEARGLFLLNAAIAAHQDDIQGDDKTIVAAIRLRSSITPVASDWKMIAPHERSPDLADTILSASPETEAQFTDRAPSTSLGLEERVRGRMLPWLQTIFLVLVLLILLAGKIQWLYNAFANWTPGPGDFSTDLIGP